MGGRAAGAALSADAVVWLVNSLHILQSLSFVRPVQPVLASIILQLRLKIEPFRGLTIDWDRHTCPHTPRPRLIRHEVSGLVLHSRKLAEKTFDDSTRYQHSEARHRVILEHREARIVLIRSIFTRFQIGRQRISPSLQSSTIHTISSLSGGMSSSHPRFSNLISIRPQPQVRNEAQQVLLREPQLGPRQTIRWCRSSASSTLLRSAIGNDL